MEEFILQSKRVAKKTKGGTVISFSALSLVGNKEGKVGYGFGKSKNMKSAIQKSINKANSNLFDLNILNGTLPYDLLIEDGACKIYLKPAPEGSGLIAGSSVRKILELAGVKNASAKIIGTKNKSKNSDSLIKALYRFKKVK